MEATHWDHGRVTVHVPAQWLPEPELLDSLDTAALAVGTDG